MNFQFTHPLYLLALIPAHAGDDMAFFESKVLPLLQSRLQRRLRELQIPTLEAYRTFLFESPESEAMMRRPSSSNSSAPSCFGESRLKLRPASSVAFCCAATSSRGRCREPV